MEVSIQRPVFFPMINYGFPTTAMTEKSNRTFSPISREYWVQESAPKVIAGTFLDHELCSNFINGNYLIHSSIVRQNHFIEVINKNGRLVAKDCGDDRLDWIGWILFAKDCQSSNVIVMADSRGVFLQTARHIAPGETLFLWFHPSVQAIMQIPALMPFNFRGDMQYVCHKCNTSFENPNPLKIHLALDCDQLEKKCLWQRLATELSTPSFSLSKSLSHLTICELPYSNLVENPTRLVSPPKKSPIRIVQPIAHERMGPPSCFSSPPRPHNEMSLIPLNLTSPSTSSRSSGELSQHSAPLSPSGSSSAFHEYVPETLSPCDNKVQLPRLHTDYRKSAQLPAKDILLKMSPAEVEHCLSNSGKIDTEDGPQFVCVICNKLYSRKYGLKIHLRTHTGYKPLRCPDCGRQFGDPSNLNKHRALHENPNNIGPYSCRVCNRRHTRQRDLLRHIRNKHCPDN